MISALDTYLGWEQPQHMVGCKRPSWDVAVRRERASRHHYNGEPPLTHACPQENCPHGNSYDQFVVRIVCRSCGAAQVVTGEHTPDTGTTTTSTRHLGYGLAPRQAAGLLLWPGQPWLHYDLRAAQDEPHDFVVTRARVKQPTADNIVGQISQGRGKQGGVLWTALAVPHPEGRYGYGQHLRWLHANDGRGLGGTPLRTIAAAAKWIAARLTDTATGGAR